MVFYIISEPFKKIILFSSVVVNVKVGKERFSGTVLEILLKTLSLAQMK